LHPNAGQHFRQEILLLPPSLSSTPSSLGDAYTDDHMPVPIIPIITTEPFVLGNNVAGEKLAETATEMEANEAPSSSSEMDEIATDFEEHLASDLASADPEVDPSARESATRM
jgi:hypothetical protein